MVKDLTKGSPLRILFFFALPMLIGNIFQQFYNIVDSVIVGNFVGSDALAAVGAAFPIVFLSISVAQGLSMGASVVVSQQFGARRIREMKTTISTAVISMLVLAALVMAVGAVAARPLLVLLKTPENIIGDSGAYLRIYFFGAVFLFMYNIFNATYTALGDSRSPLVFLMLATVINVILDYSFVVYLHMGVPGVAWATLIAQGVSAILAGVFLLRKLMRLENDEEGPHIWFDRISLQRIARIGVPSMVQQSIVSVSMMAMQGLVNTYGSDFIAGYTAATKIDTIAMMPMMNFSNALSSYTAQNVGAGKLKRVRKGYQATILMTLCFCVVITLAIYLFGPSLIGIFMDSNQSAAVIDYGVSYMKVVSIFYLLMGVMFASNGVLRGSGDMSAFLISSMSNLGARVICAYVLNALIGNSAIWWSIPIGWLIGSVIAVGRFLSGKWKGKGVVQTKPVDEA